MRVAVILIAILWSAASIVAFVRTRHKPLDAKLTAAYILIYPLLASLLYLLHPAPLWLAVPLVFGFIPWLLAGPHLGRILRWPEQIRDDEIIGIPRGYWLWGGIGAVLLGLVFN